MIFLLYLTVMDPKELVTGLEKRELLNEEAGKDPVCELFLRTVCYCHFYFLMYTFNAT